jgi:hypothetical protein
MYICLCIYIWIGICMYVCVCACMHVLECLCFWGSMCARISTLQEALTYHASLVRQGALVWTKACHNNDWTYTNSLKSAKTPRSRRRRPLKPLEPRHAPTTKSQAFSAKSQTFRAKLMQRCWAQRPLSSERYSLRYQIITQMAVAHIRLSRINI